MLEPISQFRLELVAHRLLSDYRKANPRAIPDTCQVCGTPGKVDGHHPDYTKPLDVVWLCRRCHARVHANRLTILI